MAQFRLPFVNQVAITVSVVCRLFQFSYSTNQECVTQYHTNDELCPGFAGAIGCRNAAKALRINGKVIYEQE